MEIIKVAAFSEENKAELMTVGKHCGDVEQDLPDYFKSPTPGGSGLLTRLALITNLIKLYKLQN